MRNFKFKFEEGDKCLVVIPLDWVKKGEIVKIRRVDYGDTVYPYEVQRIGGIGTEWAEQRKLKLLHNSVKKL